MESRLDLITTQLSGLVTSINDIRTMLVLQNDKIDLCIAKINTMETKNIDMHSKISELERQVQSISTKDLYSEFRNRFERENNVIMYGIEESLDTEGAVKDILNKVYRLGQLQNNNSVPRPLKIEFQTKEIALSVLRNKLKLPKSKYPNLKISNDYTPRQKEEISSVFKELEERKAKGENLKIKFFNGQPQIISGTTKIRREDFSPNQNIPKITRTE
ncbi:unnamed protein product [Psylliodes chrysocephalus]|uniref:Uncharacterized protein n=1 Tax=Psylliodes chrysocephalus TaxID=3402493 RepID=A0A9P0G983_9CUCU|nr:unnamed protein product [Psylliodes chrysocephala]